MSIPAEIRIHSTANSGAGGGEGYKTVPLILAQYPFSQNAGILIENRLMQGRRNVG